MSLSDRSCGKRNEWRDNPVLGILASRQPCRDADAVGFRTILAHFALAFEPRDRNAYSDDSRNWAAMKSRGASETAQGLAREPSCFVRQPRHRLEQTSGFLEELDGTVGMHRDVVPGRHDLSGLLFGRVP